MLVEVSLIYDLTFVRMFVVTNNCERWHTNGYSILWLGSSSTLWVWEVELLPPKRLTAGMVKTRPKWKIEDHPLWYVGSSRYIFRGVIFMILLFMERIWSSQSQNHVHAFIHLILNTWFAKQKHHQKGAPFTLITSLFISFQLFKANGLSTSDEMEFESPKCMYSIHYLMS